MRVSRDSPDVPLNFFRKRAWPVSRDPLNSGIFKEFFVYFCESCRQSEIKYEHLRERFGLRGCFLVSSTLGFRDDVHSVEILRGRLWSWSYSIRSWSFSCENFLFASLYRTRRRRRYPRCTHRVFGSGRRVPKSHSSSSSSSSSPSCYQFSKKSLRLS